MHPFADCIGLWVSTWCGCVFDFTTLEEELELWSYTFTSIAVHTPYWPRVPWQPDLCIFSWHMCRCFLSILTSSTKLEAVSITVRTLNSYSFFQTWIIHGPIRSTAHSSNGMEWILHSGSRPLHLPLSLLCWQYSQWNLSIREHKSLL